MGHIKKVVDFRVTRFGLAGAANTAVNFVVLNVLVSGLHQDKLLSSIVATSCAIAVSFMLNRTFVFGDTAHPAKKLARFLAVSVCGVLLIQTSAYALGLLLLHNREAAITSAVYSMTGAKLSTSFVAVNISNLIASLAVMFWNYNGYRLFVFSGKRQQYEHTEDISTEAA